MHEVLVNRLGGLSLSRKSVVRLTDLPDMTLDVYRGRKTTIQQQQQFELYSHNCIQHFQAEATLKCLSIGTPNTTTFPFVPNRKWWLLGVPVFERIIIRL